MTLNSDIILSHPLWERADNELVNGPDDVSIFKRLIDIYLLACAIGIKEDKVIIDIEKPLANPKTIGRNTYQSAQNQNLYDMLNFMLINSIVNSKKINYNIEERLKLAFDPDYTNTKFSPASFLTGFANYGIEQIFKKIKSSSHIVILEDLRKYFVELEESDYKDILKNLTLSAEDFK